MYKLHETLWVYQRVVTRQNWYHVSNFKATRGTTQDGLISLTLFNMVVDNVVRTWMTMTVEDQVVT